MGKSRVRVYINQYKDSAFVDIIISSLVEIYSQPKADQQVWKEISNNPPEGVTPNGLDAERPLHLTSIWVIPQVKVDYSQDVRCGTVPVDTKTIAFILEEIREFTLEPFLAFMA